MSPFISNDLPTNIGRAALHTLAYLVFQLPGFTKISITREARELLPHVFTLSQLTLGGLFSVALSVIQVFIPKSLPVRKRDALCCPDFPLSQFYIGTAIEWLAFFTKVLK